MRLNWVNWFQLLPTPDHVQCTKVLKSIEGLTCSKSLVSEICKWILIKVRFSIFLASWKHWVIYKLTTCQKVFFFLGVNSSTLIDTYSLFDAGKKVLRIAAIKYKGKIFLPCLTRNWIKLQKKPKNEVLLKYSKGLLK